MICRQCLRKASLQPSRSTARSFASAVPPGSIASRKPRPYGRPAATSTSAAQPFSTPLSPAPDAKALGAGKKPKGKASAIPVSSCPAGTALKGLNFFKGKEDPVALPEEEYPEWLWRCLDDGKKSGVDSGGGTGMDEFSKSKKQRREAAKAQRKLEAKLIASGNMDSLMPKVPIQQQSIDLPWNEDGNVDGASKAAAAREEIRSAMRQERRAKIKESNYLKGM